MIFSDSRGKIYSHPYLRMAVFDVGRLQVPTEDELIALPAGSKIFYLPGRIPAGFNSKTCGFETVSSFRGKPAFAVAAFLIPAYLRLHHPAASLRQTCLPAGRVQNLPLWAYTAAGFYGGKFYAAAMRIDPRVRQSPRFYESRAVKKAVRSFLNKYPDNRLYRHLANCALNYNCLAAKNLFLRRWEAPLPTARACNAGCLGCLSLQEDTCISASHQRIAFWPAAEEIAQVMIEHLKIAREPIVSFGQGCEGEPLLHADTIAGAVALARKETFRGTINMNTNASLPKKVELLCKAGMDSFRVSLSSPDEKNYNIYFRPRGYKFCDVLRSIAAAKKHKKFVSINLFVFPGFTDSPSEVKALIDFVGQHKIDMIQWRNLNIDPDYYWERLGKIGGDCIGIKNLVELVRRRFPRLKMGYFNLPVSR